jgi:hypothetical protein
MPLWRLGRRLLFPECNKPFTGFQTLQEALRFINDLILRIIAKKSRNKVFLLLFSLFTA